MKSFLGFFLRFFGVWIVFSWIQRAMFMLGCVYPSGFVSLSDILKTFEAGFIFDVSIICYVFTIPFLLVVTKSFFPGFKATKWFVFWAVVSTGLSSIITASDINFYYAWGTKMNYRALSYFAYPAEVAQTILHSMALPLLTVVSFILTGFFSFWLFKISKELSFSLDVKQKVALFPVAAFFLVIGIRGGFQTFPMDKAGAYFSGRNDLNLSAINSTWNIMYDIIHPPENKNRYVAMPEADAGKILESIFVEKGNGIQVLKTTRPNLVIIHLESWSAEIIAGLGGDSAVTPNFNRLADEGLLFTDYYATGFRTEHGLIGMHSGFPAQPKTSVIRDFGKFEFLPAFSSMLVNNGYQSYVFYGGNLNFANSGPFLSKAGYQHIFGEEDFNFKGRTLWGAYDEDLFRFSLEQLDTVSSPFLAYIMTITSHEPFDETPGPVTFPGKDYPSKYKNAVSYTDRSLGKFFEAALKEKAFENTLFVLVADHSSLYPNFRTFSHPGRFKIPMLWFGPAIKEEFRGKKIEITGSQTDFPKTILSQLSLDASGFPYSRNLLADSAIHFAYFAFEDGFGVMEKKEHAIFDNSKKGLVGFSEETRPEKKDELIIKGKAIQQIIQEHYLNLETQHGRLKGKN